MRNGVVCIISKKNENNEKEFLLIKSKRDFAKHTGFYYPPGGHLEVNENEKRALIREIKEELNLDIEPIKKITKTHSDVKNEIIHWWLCKVRTGNLKIKKDEIADASYFTQKDMDKINIMPTTMKVFKRFIFNKMEK